MHVYHDVLSHYIAPLSGIPTVFTLHDAMLSEDSLEGWRYKRFANDSFIAISQSQMKITTKPPTLRLEIHPRLPNEKNPLTIAAVINISNPRIFLIDHIHGTMAMKAQNHNAKGWLDNIHNTPLITAKSNRPENVSANFLIINSRKNSFSCTKFTLVIK